MPFLIKYFSQKGPLWFEAYPVYSKIVDDDVLMQEMYQSSNEMAFIKTLQVIFESREDRLACCNL